jgi:hypothetical protein
MPKRLILSDTMKSELIKLIELYKNQKTDKEKSNIITKTFYLLNQRTKKDTIKTFFEAHC